jgi:hypothetical protein
MFASPEGRIYFLWSIQYTYTVGEYCMEYTVYSKNIQYSKGMEFDW